LRRFRTGWRGLERHPQFCPAAMHKNVETLIGRLATNSTLRRRFAASPAAVLAELSEQGLELTSIEIAALAATDPEALHSFAGALDRRLRKTTLNETEPGDNVMKTRAHRITRRTARASLAIAAALLLGGAAEAGASDWKWSVTPYVWATDMGVDVSIDDRKVVDEKIAFNDLLEDVDAVAQVHVEAQRGAHGVMFDLFDVRLSEDDNRVALPVPPGGEAVLSSESGMTVLEVGGIYDPHGDQQGFAFLYGTRILQQRAEIDARFELAPGTSIARGYETKDTLYDGLVGVRYTRRFSPRWIYQMRVDASTGGTELTWSAGSTLAYALGKNGRYAVLAGYRRMVVDFKADGSLDADMTLSGFVTGLRTSF
jgi:hypothetical protein